MITWGLVGVFLQAAIWGSMFAMLSMFEGQRTGTLASQITNSLYNVVLFTSVPGVELMEFLSGTEFCLKGDCAKPIPGYLFWTGVPLLPFAAFATLGAFRRVYKVSKNKPPGRISNIGSGRGRA